MGCIISALRGLLTGVVSRTWLGMTELWWLAIAKPRPRIPKTSQVRSRRSCTFTLETPLSFISRWTASRTALSYSPCGGQVLDNRCALIAALKVLHPSSRKARILGTGCRSAQKFTCLCRTGARLGRVRAPVPTWVVVIRKSKSLSGKQHGFARDRLQRR